VCTNTYTVENNHSRKLTKITLLNKSVHVDCGMSRGGAIDLAVVMIRLPPANTKHLVLSMFLYHTFPTIVVRLLNCAFVLRRSRKQS
jgi:hypothetical protein